MKKVAHEKWECVDKLDWVAYGAVKIGFIAFLSFFCRLPFFPVRSSVLTCLRSRLRPPPPPLAAFITVLLNYICHREPMQMEWVPQAQRLSSSPLSWGKALAHSFVGNPLA